MLLGPQAHGDHHTALADCINGVRLYNRYATGGKEKDLAKAKNKLLHSKAPQSVVRDSNYVIDGVCMAGFYPAKCICGQPSKVS